MPFSTEVTEVSEVCTYPTKLLGETNKAEARSVAGLIPIYFFIKKILNQNDQSTAVSARTQLFRAFQRKTQNICHQILVRSALETLFTLKSETCTSQMGLIEVMFAFAFAF